MNPATFPSTGTVMYTAHFPRLHPSDFRVKSLYGVAKNWPIDYDTLVPFFEENDRMMGISGLSGDPGVPPRNPPLLLGRSGKMPAKAMNRLGWHWWPSDNAAQRRHYPRNLTYGAGGRSSAMCRSGTSLGEPGT
jgi:choline dehydrogenase-like flavoprotein